MEVLGLVGLVRTVAGGVPGVPAAGFLAGPELGFGLVVVGLPPEAPGLWCPPPGAAPPVEGVVGDVGMAEPPSERPPELEGDGSAVVGVGAVLDCVGALAARPSIWVPIEPPPGGDDVLPDDEGVGVDCAVGDDSPETGEPPPVCEGPDVLGVLEEPLESEPLDEGPPGVGSSKSDRDGPVDGVGLEYGVSGEDVFPESDPGPPEPEPESGPGPTFGAPMSLPPVSADMPLPMFAPGMLPLPVRVEVLESDPDEVESEDEELEEESEDEEESELPGPELLPVSPPPESPTPTARRIRRCGCRWRPGPGCRLSGRGVDGLAAELAPVQADCGEALPGDDSAVLSVLDPQAGGVDEDPGAAVRPVDDEQAHAERPEQQHEHEARITGRAGRTLLVPGGNHDSSEDADRAQRDEQDGTGEPGRGAAAAGPYDRGVRREGGRVLRQHGA
ncbi:hypothetical protein [Streptomyces sp. NPDC093591]|uniref:hypothetical protein n=1 Tax=Streptomyces sp. NPDC093591 TaxID=3366044 RepID=UPI0037FC1EE6